MKYTHFDDILPNHRTDFVMLYFTVSKYIQILLVVILFLYQMEFLEIQKPIFCLYIFIHIGNPALPAHYFLNNI